MTRKKRLTAKQLDAIARNRNGLVRRLVEALRTAYAELADLETERRRVAEREHELTRERPEYERCGILVYGDGGIEVVSDPRVRVRIANVPALRDVEAAIKWATSRWPREWEELLRDVSAKMEVGHTKCLTRAEWELIQYKVAEVEAWREADKIIDAELQKTDTNR